MGKESESAMRMKKVIRPIERESVAEYSIEREKRMSTYFGALLY